MYESMYSLGRAESQSKILPPLLCFQGGEVEGVRKIAMDKGAEGQPVTPGGREVLNVDTLGGGEREVYL
jgi:hypothetical protein